MEPLRCRLPPRPSRRVRQDCGGTLKESVMKFPRYRLVLGAAGFAVLAALGGHAAGVAAHGEGEKVTPIFTQKLANIPGKSLTALTVDYAPGGASGAHHHAKQAEVFAYVVSGAIRSKVNDEPE